MLGDVVPGRASNGWLVSWSAAPNPLNGAQDLTQEADAEPLDFEFDKIAHVVIRDEVRCGWQGGGGVGPIGAVLSQAPVLYALIRPLLFRRDGMGPWGRSSARLQCFTRSYGLCSLGGMGWPWDHGGGAQPAASGLCTHSYGAHRGALMHQCFRQPAPPAGGGQPGRARREGGGH